MFWLDYLMEETKIKSRYELSKLSGISETSLASIKTRKTPYENMKFGNMKKIAIAIGLSLNELDELLSKQ